MAVDRAVFAAVYGGLRGGDETKTQAADVTAALQKALNAAPHGIVPINNESMGGDPAVGVQKHFGALVDIDGTRFSFACEENQTIDFN